MLTMNDLDNIMLQIQDNKEVFIYYIAHNVECREGVIDELVFKSHAGFRVLKLKVTNITNALFEYYKYLKYPTEYHTETEEAYVDFVNKYIHYYTVPNKIGPFEKEFNPRIPSAIFGYRRVHIDPVLL